MAKKKSELDKYRERFLDWSEDTLVIKPPPKKEKE